jgi:hypothetical protein
LQSMIKFYQENKISIVVKAGTIIAKYLTMKAITSK